MAFIRLNRDSLTVDVLVGIEESYKPTKIIKKFNKDVESLKGEVYKYLQDNFKTNDTAVINEELEKNKDKKEGWEKFLAEVYVPKYTELDARLKELNKKLCSNYEEVFKA